MGTNTLVYCDCQVDLEGPFCGETILFFKMLFPGFVSVINNRVQIVIFVTHYVRESS